MKINPQPPIETLTGSSCPAPNSSRESAKALTPVDASPKTPLKQKKNTMQFLPSYRNSSYAHRIINKKKSGTVTK